MNCSNKCQDYSARKRELTRWYCLQNQLLVIFLCATEVIYIHDALKYSLLSTGFSIGMYGVGTAIASFYGGKFCDKISAHLLSIISLSTSILLLLFLYFITYPYWLMLMLKIKQLLLVIFYSKYLI
jgi:hypothetical protein